MKLSTFFQTFVGALALLPSSHARSFNLDTRDLTGSSCLAFGVGNCPGPGCTTLGQVCINISGGNVVVTYPTLTGGNTYTGIHVYVGLTAPTNRAPGLFPYNNVNTPQDCSIDIEGTTAQCTIPQSNFASLGCNTQLFIAAQGDVSFRGSNTGTGWGLGGCFGCSGNGCNGNCAKYWSFSTSCQCPTVTSYNPITCIVVITPAPVTATNTCNNPNPTTSTTTADSTSTCPACAAPYFCGCSS
uniref:Uncharacterized protein n=1 Tax=Talaromyces marneffei PM1 TaxID=1077442 RepID=A0A093V356_TALMA